MRHFLTARTLSAAMALGVGLGAGLGAGPGGLTAASAQDGPIEGTIQAQVEAFLAGDAAGAFAYASPAIKGIFGTPERFAHMVENGYPMVWRPSEVRFLDRREVGRDVLQRVLMRDERGVPWVLEYLMIEGPEGWAINGVQILRAPEFGA